MAFPHKHLIDITEYSRDDIMTILTTAERFKSVNETVLDEDRLRDEEPEEYAKYMRRYFDKKLFKEEDKDRFKRYSTTRKGARRFSVQAI